jgi:DNA-binding NtrC family response regulator
MPRRVLIVEDEPAVVETLTAVLRAAEEPYVVAAAADAEQAMAAVLGQRPDVVLLDIAMPGKSGLELLKRIRTMDPSLPVIMVTGATTSAAFLEATQNGAFAFIRKPFDVRYILHLVAAALRKRPAS